MALVAKPRNIVRSRRKFMDSKRMGEIAVAILRQELVEKGIHLSPRGLGEKAANAAKMGISEAEYLEFVEHMVRAYVDQVFKKAR
ncbi:MAG: hypothetical protein WBP40_03310 [Candidatus Moraniibacteriota bacterium]